MAPIHKLSIIQILFCSCLSLYAQTKNPVEKELGYAIGQISYNLKRYNFLSDANVIYQLSDRNTLLANHVFMKKCFFLKGKVSSISFDEIFGGYTVNIEPDNSYMLIQSYRMDKQAREDAKKLIVGQTYYFLLFTTGYKNDALIGREYIAGKTIDDVAKNFAETYPDIVRENNCDVCIANLLYDFISVVNAKENTLKEYFGDNETEEKYYSNNGYTDEIIFKGNINGKYGIMMQIKIEDGVVSGNYYYTKYGSNNTLGLTGSLSNEKMQLTEYNEKGENTGFFDGILESNSYYHGTFTNYKGTKMSFELYRE